MNSLVFWQFSLGQGTEIRQFWSRIELDLLGSGIDNLVYNRVLCPGFHKYKFTLIITL